MMTAYRAHMPNMVIWACCMAIKGYTKVYVTSDYCLALCNFLPLQESIWGSTSETDIFDKQYWYTKYNPFIC